MSIAIISYIHLLVINAPSGFHCVQDETEETMNISTVIAAL